MKEVTIKSKIVGRGGASAATSPGKGVSVDMSGYLLKQIWEKVFEFRLTDDGTEYLFAKMNVAAQGGFTSFVDGGKINLPGLYDGIPFDNRTIWMNPETGVVEVLVSGGEGGAADFSHVQSSGTGNAFTSFNVSADGSRLTLVKGETFALQRVVDELDEKITNFLEGSDTDNIINKWKELEAFLSGLRESDVLSDILSEKADWGTTLAHYGITDAYTKEQVDNLLGNFVTSDDVETLLDDYLPLAGGTITGDLRLRKGSEYTSPYLYFGDSDEVWMKEATDTHLTIHADGSVKIDSPKTVIDGIEIKKSASGVLFIDANLVVSGGITMYGTDGTTANTIWDDAPIASTSVKGIASFDSEFFAVNNGKVTFIGSTGGGTADSVAWGDITGKPSWIGSSKPSYSYSEISGTPTSLKNPTSISWSGYSSGSYDGSTAKSITIPSNTNQLTNGAGFITSSDDITGNAATATTLKTSRTIWGKSFNGSGNVSGNLKLGSSSLMMESDNSYGDSSWAIFAYGTTLQFKCGDSGSSPSSMGFQISNEGVVKVFGNITANAHNGRSIGAYGTSFLKTHSNYLTSGASSNNLLLIGGSSASYGILFALNSDGGNSGHKMAMGSNRLYPYTDGGMSLGSTYYCWEALYLNTGDNAYSDADIYFNSGGTTYARIGSNNSGNLGLYARTSIVIRGGATGSNAPTTGATIDASGNLLMTGGITMYSDFRKKTILNYVELSLKEVADAPLIEHYYNSDEKKTTHVGSVAQYWAGLNDWFCKEDEEGYLTMEIQNAALASAISVARELTRYESKTDKQIKKLKKRIGELEEEIENLKKM